MGVRVKVGKVKARRQRRARQAIHTVRPLQAVVAPLPANDQPPPPPDHTRAWYVAHTAPRQERRAAEGLAEAGFGVYLPTVTVTRSHARRKVRVEAPLFERYLFVGMDPAEPDFPSVRAIDGVDAVIGAQGLPKPIPFALILQIAGDVHAGSFEEPVDVKVSAFTLDQAVRAVRGPYAGFTGRMAKCSGKKRVQVLIDALNWPVNIDLDCLESVA